MLVMNNHYLYTRITVHCPTLPNQETNNGSYVNAHGIKE